MVTRQSDNVYRLDHAVTKTQKNILNAFGLTDKNIEYRANWISEELKKSMMKILRYIQLDSSQGQELQ